MSSLFAPFVKLTRSIRERGVKGTITQLYLVYIFKQNKSCHSLRYRPLFLVFIFELDR